jgi:hypothetical protein
MAQDARHSFFQHDLIGYFYCGTKFLIDFSRSFSEKPKKIHKFAKRKKHDIRYLEGMPNVTIMDMVDCKT